MELHGAHADVVSHGGSPSGHGIARKLEAEAAVIKLYPWRRNGEYTLRRSGAVSGGFLHILGLGVRLGDEKQPRR